VRHDRLLKAREIEALTFIYPTAVPPSAAKHARSTLRPWRITVGVAGLVLLGTVAWLIFRV
jgi:hypothetical protein